MPGLSANSACDRVTSKGNRDIVKGDLIEHKNYCFKYFNCFRPKNNEKECLKSKEEKHPASQDCTGNSNERILKWIEESRQYQMLLSKSSQEFCSLGLEHNNVRQTSIQEAEQKKNGLSGILFGSGKPIASFLSHVQEALETARFQASNAVLSIPAQKACKLSEGPQLAVNLKSNKSSGD